MTEPLRESAEAEPMRVKYYPISDEAAFELSELVDAAIRANPEPTITYPNTPPDWTEEFGNINAFALIGAQDHKDAKRFLPSNPNRTVLLGPARDAFEIDAKTIDLIALTLNSRVELRSVPLGLLKQSLQRQGFEQLLFKGRQALVQFFKSWKRDR